MTCKGAIASGEIKTSKPINDYDIAVQYAIGLICDEKGLPCNTSEEEIYYKMLEFAPELLQEE